MVFDKNEQKLRMIVQIRHMEIFAAMFGPEHKQKVDKARFLLQEMQKLDPRVMSVAMLMVGCAGFVDLIDQHEELVLEMLKNR